MPYILAQCLCVMCPWVLDFTQKVLQIVELTLGHERELYFLIADGWMRLC